MADVIPFQRPAPPERTEPRLIGPAQCLACGHEWRASVPVGCGDALECEVCHACKGVLKNFVKYDEPAWHCLDCNGYLFTLLLLKDVPTVACATCGTLRNALDLWNS